MQIPQQHNFHVISFTTNASASKFLFHVQYVHFVCEMWFNMSWKHFPSFLVILFQYWMSKICLHIRLILIKNDNSRQSSNESHPGNCYHICNFQYLIYIFLTTVQKLKYSFQRKLLENIFFEHHVHREKKFKDLHLK